MVWFTTNSVRHRPVDGFTLMVNGVCVCVCVCVYVCERKVACALYPLPPLSIAL